MKKLNGTGVDTREVLTAVQEALRETLFSGSTGDDGVDGQGHHFFLIDGLDDTPVMRITISLEG